MKRGLVMEGGGMRGMFTAGVTDVLLENGITFDGAIGTSAGALFGCNIKSHQPGRAIAYNLEYCDDPRYMSFDSLIKTGSLFNTEFAYHEVPYKYYPFDSETFAKDPMEFFAVCTDVEKGEPCYHQMLRGDEAEVDWFRASGSMPLVSEIVEIDGGKYLDGGITDSIPLRFFIQRGYDRNLVVLTQPKGYVKKQNPMMLLMVPFLGKYPNTIKAMHRRPMVYNHQIEYCERAEEAGKALILQPKEAFGISRTEKDRSKLQRVYDEGRRLTESRLEEIREYLGEPEA